MTHQSSCSSSSSWLGAFARSVSGSLSSSMAKPIQSDHGVELAPLNGNCAGDMCTDIPDEGAISLPICIGRSDGAPVAWPGTRIAALAPPQPHAVQGSISAISPPLDHEGTAEDQLPTQQQQQQQHQSFSRSSSSGLPSALAVPAPAESVETCAASSALGIPATANTMQAQQPYQQQQHKVRWSLPGDDDCQGPAAEKHGRAAEQQQQVTAATGPGQDSSASKPVATLGTDAPRALVSSSSSSTSPRGSRLPSSGSEQLDKYLRYLLKENHPHRFMYYPNWGLTDDGCAAIGEFLRRDKVIKVMTLSGNDIRDDGIELIAEGLASNSCLVTLDLSSNKISDIGAIALAEALHSNKCLAELRLNNNRIGDEGAEALAAAVAASRTLKKLHLQGNLISSAQLQVVQHVLKTRQYRMPTKQPSASNLRAHLRKNSSFLQFHIELSDSEDVIRSVARHRLQLPPATAIVALSEPTDPLEESLSAQVAHLIAEIEVRSAGSSCMGQAGDLTDNGAEAPAAATSASASGDIRTKLEVNPAELVPLLALRLAWRGYEVLLRTSCPAVDASEQQWSSTAGSKESNLMGLKHTFVRVVQPGLEQESTPPIIVDPFFRENFEIAHMTERYKSVLDALPRVLCLSESRLYHLVEALTQELRIAFKESGLSCPPWRDASTILDKWLARKPQDVAVDPDADVNQLKLALVNQTGNQ